MTDTYTIRILTADGIDHGLARIESCLEANIDRFEDGYVLCPILWSGGKCEECMEVFEREDGEIWMTLSADRRQ